MHALVLNRVPVSVTRYAKMLGTEWDVTILSAESDTAPRDRETVVPINGFPDTPDVEFTAATVHSQRPIDTVISMSEHDVLRAARLREQLGIAGQSVDSALAFRDKLQMKAELAAHDVPHAQCSTAESVWDLLNLADRVGYPVVVKPRRGAGSIGVEILRSVDDVADFSRRHPELDADEPCDLMVERYVKNTMMHVDGVWVDDDFAMVCPSSHGASTWLNYHVARPVTSVMLDVDGDLHNRCVDLVRRTLEALPTPSPTIFHVELFLDGDDLLVNEVACRLGGAKIHRALEAVYEMSMIELYLGLLGGRLRPKAPLTRQGSAGWIIFPPHKGTVRSLPETPPFDFVKELRTSARVGDRLQRATVSTDAIMTAVVVGVDESAVRQRVDLVRRWFDDTVVVEPS